MRNNGVKEPPVRWPARAAQFSGRWRFLYLWAVWLEWVCEWLVYALRNFAFLELLNVAAGFSVLFAAGSYIFGADDRARAQQDERRQKHYQAWQVINMAHGRSSSGGRIDALEDLASDSVSLDRVDLAGALLPKVRLRRASLVEARLMNAELGESDLGDADLSQATLTKVFFNGSNLTNARFFGARIDTATFVKVDARGADFSFACLVYTNFKGADLRAANFEGVLGASAYFGGANLAGANLSKADFRFARLDSADLAGVKNWRSANFTGATFHYARNLPDGLVALVRDSARAAVVESSEQTGIDCSDYS